MGPGFIILFILAVFGPVVAGDCNTAPDINGCSIPSNLNIPNFFEDVFERDCNKRDICYACGRYCGVSRSTCDTRFNRNIQATCNIDYRVKMQPLCQDDTTIFILAHVIGGSRDYNQTSPCWCSLGSRCQV